MSSNNLEARTGSYKCRHVFAADNASPMAALAGRTDSRAGIRVG